MITVLIRGGLGNQLFQYACGRAIATAENTSLVLDPTILSNNKTATGELRPFSLQHFSITGETRALPKQHPFVVFLKRMLRAIRYRIFKHDVWHIGFDERILAHPPKLLDGYFQSPRYFDAITDTLRRELTLHEPLSATAARYESMIQSDTHSVSVHIRRGDYLYEPEFGGICDEAYYAQALTHVLARQPNAHFFVFSDDTEWCRSTLPALVPASYTFIEKSIPDYEALWLMSRCRGHIIANSTFSWWGAWLDPNPNALVLCPARWTNFPDHAGLHRDKQLPGWVLI